MVTSEELFVRLLWNGYRGVARPVLFRMANGDPEEVHRRCITLLSSLPEPVLSAMESCFGMRGDPVEVAGISFPGRVGVGAGLDKDGVAARVWSAMGFGFAELGTVTPRPQPGNRLPRLFRLPHSHAIINRMGFNNLGVEALSGRLDQWGARRGNYALGCPMGVSIGKNKTTPLDKAVDDYLYSLRTIEPYADYVAINVSSPNTPGLRSLQDQETLSQLTQSLVELAAELNPDRPMPIFVKLSPDLAPYDLSSLIEVCQDTGVSGLIATNTTTAREYMHPSEMYYTNQAGGLSGRPLTQKALRTVESVAKQTDLPIMGMGGIMTPGDAQSFFDAGAILVQVYTGFIFNGLALVEGTNTLTYPDRTRI